MNEIGLKRDSFFAGLITSKTRAKILMRLFLNPKQKAYVRALSSDFGVSTSLVSEELKRLTEAGLLVGKKNGRQVDYQANTGHVLFPELQSMVKKALGMDRIFDSIIERLGNLEQAYLIDDYAEGRDTGLIDLVLVGEIDHENLRDLVTKTERYAERKIRTLVLTDDEFARFGESLRHRPHVLLWRRGDKPTDAG